MSNYETITTIVSIVAAVIAIIAAGNASVSARHAKDQAEEARRQTELLQRTMTFDQLTHAVRIRRTIQKLKDLSEEARKCSRAPLTTRKMGDIMSDLRSATDALADAPPVFSPDTRARITTLIMKLENMAPQISTADNASHDDLFAAHDAAVAATTIEIDRETRTIDDSSA